MTVASDLLREWMPHQRWFGGKGREWADVAESGFFLERESPVLSVHRLLEGAVGEPGVPEGEVVVAAAAAREKARVVVVERTRTPSISGSRSATTRSRSQWPAKRSHKQLGSSKRLAGRSMDRSLR